MFLIVLRRFWFLFAISISLTLLLFYGKAQARSSAAFNADITQSFPEHVQSSTDLIQPSASKATKSSVITMQSRSSLFDDPLNALDTSAAQANVGIGVLALNTGESWFLNGKQQFPMQSVFKLPVGIAVLKLVDQGRLSLDQLVTISRQEFAPGWSPILQEINGDSGQFTVRDLLERSVGASDNTAADALVRLVGGPEQRLMLENISS